MARQAAGESRHMHGGFFCWMAKWTSYLSGRPLTFVLATLAIIVWIASGPLFGFSDTWQLVVNTATTIITFLMVFLIQNTPNRDTQAIQIKLDELIRSQRGGHNALLDLEELTDEELSQIRDQYEDLAREARVRLRKGISDTGTPEPGKKRKRANILSQSSEK